MTAEGSAGGVGLGNSCESALYWQHAGYEVWNDVYAKQVSELLRTYLMLHDLVEVAVVTLQVRMSQGESNDEVPLEKVNMHNDWWPHSQVHVPAQLAVVTLHSEVRKAGETRRLFSSEGQGAAYAFGSH